MTDVMNYISEHHTVTFYQATCPICDWKSMPQPEQNMEMLQASTGAHINMCEAGEKVGLVRCGNSKLIRVNGRAFRDRWDDPEFLCEWKRENDGLLLVYDRGITTAELLFVDERGNIVESYEVPGEHHWAAMGCPWLEKGGTNG